MSPEFPPEDSLERLPFDESYIDRETVDEKGQGTQTVSGPITPHIHTIGLSGYCEGCGLWFDYNKCRESDRKKRPDIRLRSKPRAKATP